MAKSLKRYAVSFKFDGRQMYHWHRSAKLARDHIARNGFEWASDVKVIEADNDIYGRVTNLREVAA